MEHIMKILSVSDVTHDVKCIRIEKPENYSFVPGQATDVSIDKDGWREAKRPFTSPASTAIPTLNSPSNATPVMTE